MVVQNQLLTGGLVFKTAEIIKILNEPNAVGIAFGVPSDQQANNVNLDVFKVIKKNDEYFGIPKVVNFKLAATKHSLPPIAIENCQFEYHEKMVACKFSFGYLSKDRFMELFQKNEDEVFVTGAKINFGSSLETVNGEWFTLSVATRINPGKDKGKMGKLPPFVLMEGCPPVWTKPGDSIIDGFSYST